jgi:hypothetical protein
MAKKRNPAPLAAGRASEWNCSAANLHLENSSAPHDLQVVYLARRFGISAPIAGSIASLVFGASR